MTSAETPTTAGLSSAASTPAVIAVAEGVDPGLASTGVAVIVRWSTGQITSAGAWFLETHRDKTVAVRAGMDDARRMRDFWDSFCAINAWARPNVVGVEDYETYQPRAITELKTAAERLVNIGVPKGASGRRAFAEKIADDDRYAGAWIEAVGGIGRALGDAEGWTPTGLGQAAKTIGVQWIASCAAYAYSTPVYINTSTHMKKTVAGKPRASKEDVEAAVVAIVEGAREHADAACSPSKRNHVFDSYGHALCALYEFERWRAAYGR